MKNSNFTRVIGIMAGTALLLVSVSCGGKDKARDEKRPTKVPEASTSSHADIEVNPTSYPFTFVAYGDLRSTEHEWFGQHVTNPGPRKAIISDIVTRKPDFLVMTGDFVFRGFKREDWEVFNKEIEAVKSAGITVFPAVGNHEVGPYPPWMEKSLRIVPTLARKEGLELYDKEFPTFGRKPNEWYSVKSGNCYFLILDSQLDSQDVLHQQLQLQWVKDQLAALPQEVDFVFVVLHSAIYTAVNDDVHRPGDNEKQLAKTLEEKQSNIRARIIVISGHVHNYERYVHRSNAIYELKMTNYKSYDPEDVTYIVSGGGGAEPVCLYRISAKECRSSGTWSHPRRNIKAFQRSNQDLYGRSDASQHSDTVGDPYHYCLFTVNHSKLTFQMMKLVRNGTGVTFQESDSFELLIKH